MCEITNPNVPVGSMGEIRFPSDGVPGSGDVIMPSKKKRTFKQKSANKILSFDDFIKINKKISKKDM